MGVKFPLVCPWVIGHCHILQVTTSLEEWLSGMPWGYLVDGRILN